MRARARDAGLVAVWLVLVLASATALALYKRTPGVAASPPARWPQASSISRSETRSTLVVFAHPKCPCTRATLTELRALLATSPDRVATHVVFMRPANESDSWTDTGIVALARSIPGVAVRTDEGGAEAVRFNAVTSGQVLLYDASGTLLYRGGITSARGHEGDNEGRRAIQALLSTSGRAMPSGPVFGCSLEDPELAARDEVSR